ncbi:MAG: lipoprotein-releasing ABC transporter permease subunit [Rhodospirillales bacterium]|nr:lipoprotein-releasing ABC transporter permease subunit [Alphaproteobacteria bacterium]MCB9987362.1 lipoprotein-releasing ABC transporter permease subunit [Rhodospirillales bacterium]USO08535.1 MAG: lipoprotein-releasing ABC transporter permease subunit [Rhodospirillales bacterium]
MFSVFERMMAWRYLRARKAEGFVSVIAGFSFMGILLGVATLIIVMSVMNGFRAELMGRLLGLNGHLNVVAPKAEVVDYDALAARLGQVPGVTGVFPMIERQALLTSGGRSSGVMVRGLSAESFAKKPVLADGIREGSLAEFGEDGAAIGVEMARKLGLKIGDSILLISPQGKATPFGTMPRSRTFTISVIFDVEMYEYNANFVFIPLAAAQSFFGTGDGVDALEIFTTDPARSDAVARKLAEQIPPDMEVIDWKDSNKSFFGALQVERNVMFLILTLIILVAAFNIISSMIMLVKDKGRDIAILRTMGATRGSMLKIFILTGATIGVVGTLAGAGVGIAFALNIESIREFLQGLTGTQLFSPEVYFLSKLPAKLDWSEVGAVLAMAFGLSFLATLYPAWRAARLDPVEALRYE